jgi:hypothetical protein
MGDKISGRRACAALFILKAKIFHFASIFADFGLLRPAFLRKRPSFLQKSLQSRRGFALPVLQASATGPVHEVEAICFSSGQRRDFPLNGKKIE